jgi:hypothetical protein
MVFVSMDQDELLTRTAQYQIQYLPARSTSRSNIAVLSSVPTVYSIRHDEDGRIVTRVQPRSRRQYSIPIDDDDDFRTAQVPPEFNVSPPPFNITTECSADEDDSEGTHWHGYPPGRRMSSRPPNRIGALPFESDNSEDGGVDPWGPSTGSYWSNFDDLTRAHSSSRLYNLLDRGERASPTTLAEAQEASQLATQEAVRAVGGELMAPLTHFHIEKDKNKCTIRFDPPVSGRFILLKMWNPHHDPSGNIDIQGVIAKGFAGPRLFPSIELR